MFSLGYGEMLIVGICALILFGDRLPEIGRAVERSWDEDPIGLLLLVSFGIMIFLFIVTLCWTFGRCRPLTGGSVLDLTRRHFDVGKHAAAR